MAGCKKNDPYDLMRTSDKDILIKKDTLYQNISINGIKIGSTLEEFKNAFEKVEHNIEEKNYSVFIDGKKIDRLTFHFINDKLFSISFTFDSDGENPFLKKYEIKFPKTLNALVEYIGKFPLVGARQLIMVVHWPDKGINILASMNSTTNKLDIGNLIIKSPGNTIKLDGFNYN